MSAAAAHIKVFGGGGGVIVPSEIAELHAYGVERIYSPGGRPAHGPGRHDRRHDERCDFDLVGRTRRRRWRRSAAATTAARRALAQLITALENGAAPPALRARADRAPRAGRMPVLGITGTGGAGKSSLTDELIRRFRLDRATRFKIAIISIDPSQRKSGGALLGDRIRMNAIEPERRPARLHALARHARLRLRDRAALPDVIAA